MPEEFWMEFDVYSTLGTTDRCEIEEVHGLSCFAPGGHARVPNGIASKQLRPKCITRGDLCLTRLISVAYLFCFLVERRKRFAIGCEETIQLCLLLSRHYVLSILYRHAFCSGGGPLPAL